MPMSARKSRETIRLYTAPDGLTYHVYRIADRVPTEPHTVGVVCEISVKPASHRGLDHVIGCASVWGILIDLDAAYFGRLADELVREAIADMQMINSALTPVNQEASNDMGQSGEIRHVRRWSKTAWMARCRETFDYMVGLILVMLDTFANNHHAHNNRQENASPDHHGEGKPHNRSLRHSKAA